jgi:hypothetical protein
VPPTRATGRNRAERSYCEGGDHRSTPAAPRDLHVALQRAADRTRDGDAAKLDEDGVSEPTSENDLDDDSKHLCNAARIAAVPAAVNIRSHHTERRIRTRAALRIVQFGRLGRERHSSEPDDASRMLPRFPPLTTSPIPN